MGSVVLTIRFSWRRRRLTRKPPALQCTSGPGLRDFASGCWAGHRYQRCIRTSAHLAVCATLIDDLRFRPPSQQPFTDQTPASDAQVHMNSTVANDCDIFVSSKKRDDHGTGSPDVSSTGPGVKEDLTLTDPGDGLWHIRFRGLNSAFPSAHLVATMNNFSRKPFGSATTASSGDPALLNYAASEKHRACPGFKQFASHAW